MLPLYSWNEHSISSGDEAQRQIQHMGCHPGLWFERFFNQYDVQYQIKDTAKSTFIKGIAGGCGNKEVLQQAYIRQLALIESCSGNYLTVQADWHFATGLGNPHPVENGFLFHPTLAVPYLPGSSVKGIVRSWMEQNIGAKEGANILFHRLFGSEDKNPDNCEQDSQAGDVIFFDAFPVIPARLVLDIMTPHAGKWYEKGGTAEVKEAKNQPADWHDPVPVPFLAARDLVFLFSFAPRKHMDDADQLMQLTSKALRAALKYAGAGAKTAAGYGYFSDVDDKNAIALKKLNDKLRVAIEEKQKSAKLALLSDEAKTIENLKEQSQIRSNQLPDQAADFVNHLKAVLESAHNWPSEEKNALVDFYDYYKQFLSKKKEKELKTIVKDLRAS